MTTNNTLRDCPHKSELHWHVKPCQHGIWPKLFCKNCNGVYEQQIVKDIAHLSTNKEGEE